MKICLDTNAYVAMVNGQKDVVRLVRGAETIGLPIIVLGELYFGIYDSQKQAENSLTLTKFLSSLRVEVLRSDEQTAKIFGEIASELKKVGRPVQQNDIWIASVAKQNGYTLLSADKGFTSIVGLDLISFKP